MDVLHLYSGNLFGGVERLLVTLSSAAPHHRVALGFDGRLASELRGAGRTPALLGPVRFRSPGSVLRARRGLSALLDLQRPDAVVCHSAWAHALFAGRVRKAGLPLAFFLHDLVTGRHWLERLARRHAPDVVLANSALTAGTASSLFPGVHTEVVTLPLPGNAPVGDRAAVRAAEGVGGDEPVVVVASRLAPWKGHSLLLDALAHVPADVPWRLWIVGGPRAEGEAAWLAELVERARRFGPRVRFLGERSDVPSLLAAADLHCQPNLSPEPFGLAFAEAMAAGLPVVTTHAGAAAGVVDESCARVVSPGPAQVGAALAALLVDAGARRRLGDAGKLRARWLCDFDARLAELDGVLGRIPRGSRT
ncbi:MAG: hypothetical protein RL653_3251 [Pseudomonadota bacterium]